MKSIVVSSRSVPNTSVWNSDSWIQPTTPVSKHQRAWSTIHRVVWVYSLVFGPRQIHFAIFIVSSMIILAQACLPMLLGESCFARSCGKDRDCLSTERKQVVPNHEMRLGDFRTLKWFSNTVNKANRVRSIARCRETCFFLRRAGASIQTKDYSCYYN